MSGKDGRSRSGRARTTGEATTGAGGGGRQEGAGRAHDRVAGIEASALLFHVAVSFHRRHVVLQKRKRPGGFRLPGLLVRVIFVGQPMATATRPEAREAPLE